MALVRPQDATFAVVENTDTWDDQVAAAAVAADSKIEPNPPGLFIPPGQEYVEDEALTGAAGRLPFDPGNHLPDFSIDSLNCRYDGAWLLLLALWFGSASVAAVENDAMTEIGGLHTFNIATNLDGIHGTIVADWVNAILELDIFKVSQIVLSAESGGRLDLSISGMGRRWRNDSTVNTSTEIATVTLEGPRENIMFDSLVARINAQSGDALASADEICINSFTLTLDRQLDGPVTTCDPPYRDEVVGPAPGWVGTIAFDIPRWQNTDLQDAHVAGTVQKMDLRFTGSTLPDGDGDGTDDKEFNIDLPALTITGYEFSEQGTIGESITAELGRAGSTPSGMNDVNPEIRVQNERDSSDGAYLS